MFLKTLSLQNFRNYNKASFTFTKDTTLITGPNTSGKTNILEAITLLATGKSYHLEKDAQLILFGKQFARITGAVDDTTVEVLLTAKEENGRNTVGKRYLVNTIPRRRVDFASHLPVVSFSPADIEIILDGPSMRRRMLNEVLEQADRDYRIALASYEKALRQRNALLQRAQETGLRVEKQFSYWDGLLITHGQLLTAKREAYVAFLNTQTHDVFPLLATYDKSIISEERLLQYKDAEIGAGVTLVGPHRDDVFFSIHVAGDPAYHDVRAFGSRGQQRLVVLQLKLLQIVFVEQALGVRPLLLLDDIFSELDDTHIALVLSLLGKQQTILTTTHQEFVDKKLLSTMDVISLRL